MASEINKYNKFINIELNCETSLLLHSNVIPLMFHVCALSFVSAFFCLKFNNNYAVRDFKI